MIYLIGIAAALLLGAGYVLQQRVAVTAPLADILHWRLLLDLMRRRVWWLGVAAMVIGQLLAAVALRFASVDVVEPLLSSNLLFALALAALLSRQRPRPAEIGGAALLSAALGVFLAVAQPRSSSHVVGVERMGLVAVACVAAVVLATVLIGRRRGLVGESIWLSCGAGLLFGLQDAATRATLVDFDHHGALSVLGHMWVYVLLACAALGILLAQSAFKAARLSYSLPPITAAEPIAGIALGIALLGDRISLTTLGLGLECACVVALIAGVALIGRSRSLAIAKSRAVAGTAPSAGG
jgi:drug/metabolite transporter (DMT)-like permease